MAIPLTTLDDVPWHEIKDSSGSAAAIPDLLTALASDDLATAQEALRRLRERICQYGFVVEQATAATVPFLWELALRPGVTCRPQILQLLSGIVSARQWESMAAAYPKLLHYTDDYVGWEREARAAVRARRHVLPRLLDAPDPELVRAAQELAAAIAT
ncbi:hypothetical protein [Streptomyces poonensis]|uniref:AbaA n=1 Tax=Streptomyces poonensis TaxID=68255 RepID=A0A918PD46_9ACTN|nr:hypothetical protein [Streptomyces poonensis]GGZ00087.1 hypothetical protein GCM10010365_18560 [Streptomyces poonensis]GLJ92156.1 hypothetical protein GCM10017589_47650 [Streptomyces poonensis]